MRRGAAAILVLALLATGCGEGVGEEDTAPGTVPPASTTTTAATVTTPALSTTQPEPTTTSTTAPAWAGPGFPEALAPEVIPWDQVGPGWLLVRFRETSGEVASTPAREALFLIDPANVTYAVVGWDGREILDWSPEGRRVLVFDSTLKVIGLLDGVESAVPAVVPVGWRIDARFVPPAGEDIVVRAIAPDEHARLERVGADGTLRATLADFDFPAYSYGDPEYVEMGITWLYGPDGTELVVATGEGISLRDEQGVVVRSLDTPGLGCTLSRWWAEGSVLAACYDRDWAASACWYRGPIPDGRSLWAVPIDGSAAVRLTPAPVCTAEAPEFSAAYQDGLPVGAGVAAEAGGCCECGGSLELVAGDAVVPWAGYPESPACSPRLIATRGDRVLVLDTVFGWEAGQGTTGMLGAILEVAGDGATLGAITPVEPGRYGGVQQVLTTEETGR